MELYRGLLKTISAALLDNSLDFLKIMVFMIPFILQSKQI